ncbi:PREDICTED: scarecrow-like transcription factor PAT1 [Nicotiana attenuata]|uniref:Scarecrow-like transcription factor pat1 n=1 Tax=Nicotiana attenuata TaxID=49451 RepID=A0A314L4L9_NICAT|nr:PREDICTED: scarecrow-like transcription factor PAT1 [Nicotiana attenuata]OIT36546.1 scarecrow-like transcription factor pat1 [Nicotiana attenuata]
MRPSQNAKDINEFNRFYNQPVEDQESFFLPSINNPNNNQLLYADCGQQTQFSALKHNQYCYVESSTGNSSELVSDSPPADTFFADDNSMMHQGSDSCPSGMHHSPDDTYHSSGNSSCFTSDGTGLKHKLKELETAMLGPDSESLESYNTTPLAAANQISSESGKWVDMMEMMPNGDLKQVLIACAKAIADNNLVTAEWLMSELRTVVSVCGSPIQRLGAYMLEGLVARLASSGSSIYKSLRCKEPTSVELMSYMHLLYEICPYFKFGYLSANGAIVDAMKEENTIHIIDFQISQGSQWITLIHALAARPGGPPRIRITGIDDSTSAYARGGGIEIVGRRLSSIAASCNVPFEFHPVAASCSDVEIEHLKVRSGEPLAVNFALILHHMPDESVGTQNHRDRLLRMVKSLTPKIVTLVEQESNTNRVQFFPRFLETLNYYLSIFESIDVALPRDHKQRINVEQHCLAREIVNIIACEGAERVERHELLERWRSRFLMAGFNPYPLSSSVNATIKTLLENYYQSYTLDERNGALYLGWMKRDLVASCAWK